MFTIHSEKNNLEQKAGEALDAMFQTQGKPLLMLLSGGSSLKLLDLIQSSSLSNTVTAGMLDDRYSSDPSINSFGLLKNTQFYKQGIEKGLTFLDSSVHEGETLEQYGERYEGYVKAWIAAHPDGVIRATIGIGPDGHTSGVLPHPEDPAKFDNLFNGDALVIGYDVGDKNIYRYRMTSTFVLMRKFDAVLTYMTGENKKDALQKVMKEEGSLPETPGRIIRELNNVNVYTDVVL